MYKICEISLLKRFLLHIHGHSTLSWIAQLLPHWPSTVSEHLCSDCACSPKLSRYTREGTTWAGTVWTVQFRQLRQYSSSSLHTQSLPSSTNRCWMAGEDESSVGRGYPSTRIAPTHLAQRRLHSAVRRSLVTFWVASMAWPVTDTNAQTHNHQPCRRLVWTGVIPSCEANENVKSDWPSNHLCDFCVALACVVRSPINNECRAYPNLSASSSQVTFHGFENCCIVFKNFLWPFTWESMNIYWQGLPD